MEAGFGYVMHRHRRHHRFARAAVALQQSVHRLGFHHVLEELPRRLALGVGELEGQGCDERPRHVLIEGYGVGGMSFTRSLSQLIRELVEEDFLELKAAACSLEGFHRFRKVDLLDGGGARGEAASRNDLSGVMFVWLGGY